MDKATIAGEEMEDEVIKSGDCCRFGEDCISQDKCPSFLVLKEQLNSAVKGTDQYSRLLNRSVLKSG